MLLFIYFLSFPYFIETFGADQEDNLLKIAKKYAAWSMGNNMPDEQHSAKNEPIPGTISMEEYNQLRWNNIKPIIQSSPSTSETNVTPVRKFRHYIRVEPKHGPLPMLQPVYTKHPMNQTFVMPNMAQRSHQMPTNDKISLLDPYPRMKSPSSSSNIPTNSPKIVNNGVFHGNEVSLPSERQSSRLIISNEMIEESKKTADISQIAQKKQRFGMRRANMFPDYEDSCQMGWCGSHCCPNPPVHATTLPGSPTPSQPFVVVIHPNPSSQCAPSCQPQCLPQCTSHVQFAPFPMSEMIPNRPFCRSDCMPSCHVDCLIMPPSTIRCTMMPCRCSGAYVQCSPFTCCIRYPNMLKKHRSQLEKNTSTEIEHLEISSVDSPLNSVGQMNSPERSKSYRKNRGKAALRRKLAILTSESRRGEYRKYSTTSAPRRIIITSPPPTTTTPMATTTSSTTTTTTTTTAPTTTSEVRTTTYRVTPMPRVITRRYPVTTTPMPEEEIKSKIKIVPSEIDMRPIYPLKLTVTTQSPIPFIPDYKMWTFKKQSKKMNPQAIRSDNFLEILTELAQVNHKEDIIDYQNAHSFLKYLTDTGK